MSERVPIASITIGERRRQELGDVSGLAANIDAHGLLHPLIIAADGELIAGERRLRACQSLGWKDIDVRRWPDLSESERREIELAENLNRKDLTPAERSRDMIALADTTEEVLTEIVKTPNGGRPAKRTVSEQAIADRMGVPRTTLNLAQRHVAALNTYPELETLSQSEALALAGTLNDLPDDERESLRTALAESGAMPSIDEMADALTDDAGRDELDRLRYLKKLQTTLKHIAKLAVQYDPADVAAYIDDDFLRLNIDAPLHTATAWAERVRAEMPKPLQVIQGGRS